MKNVYTITLLLILPLLTEAQIVINEILTQNYGSLTNLYDEDGDSPDYIELYNTTNAAINISGWKLVNEDNIWLIPNGVSLRSNSYLSIWASGKDKSVNALHTNFELGTKGEYLGLYDAQNNLVFDFGAKYPTQYNNLSYGVSTSGAFRYFNTITKGAANGNGLLGKVATPEVSTGRGYYYSSITETLQCATPNATIRYTLDGKMPNLTSRLYNGPISITANTSGIVTLRAKAFANGYAASKEISISYIFPSRIFPNNLDAQKGMSSLPMVVLNQDDQFNLGSATKRRVAFEYFELDASNTMVGISENAAVNEFG